MRLPPTTNLVSPRVTAVATAAPEPNPAPLDQVDRSPQPTSAKLTPPSGVAVGQSALRVRLQQCGATVTSALKNEADAFLADPRVVAMGTGIGAISRPAINGMHNSIDDVLVRVGLGANLIAEDIEVSAAQLERQAHHGQRRLHRAANRLRERASGLSTTREAHATAHTLIATADRIDALAQSGVLREMCARGGAVAFRVAAAGMDVVAELAFHGGRAAACGITFAGRAVRTAFGSDSMSNIAFGVYGGMRVGLGSEHHNAGVFGAVFFPSLFSPERTQAPSYYDAITSSYGASAASPFGGIGVGSRGGVTTGVNLVFVSATINSLGERVFVGVPGVFGVTLGRDDDRGSQISLGAAYGNFAGPFASYGVCLHTPLLDPINRVVTRPIAQVVVAASEAVKDTAKWTWRQVKAGI